jgi:hypothetical protein
MFMTWVFLFFFFFQYLGTEVRSICMHAWCIFVIPDTDDLFSFSFPNFIIQLSLCFYIGE